MSAGCVPVVYNAGGYKEIIDNGKNGYLWQNSRELINITKQLVYESGALTRLSKEAILSSRKYGYEEFKEKSKNHITLINCNIYPCILFENYVFAKQCINFRI